MLRRLDAAFKRFRFNKEVISERNRRFAEARTPKEKAKALEFGFPKFKSKYTDIISIHLNSGTFKIYKKDNMWYIEVPKLQPPKTTEKSDINKPKRERASIRILCDKDLPDKIKNVNISYDPVKKMWFISLTYITEFVTKDFPNKDIIGIDVGDRTSCYCADKNNRKEYNIEKDDIIFLENKKAKLQKIQARKQESPLPGRKHSSRWYKLQQKIAKIDRKISDIRSNFHHHVSKEITDNYPVVAMENLKVSDMIASNKGTAENPGKDVKKKARLNRTISRQGWYGLRMKMDYKSKRNGGKLILINPYNTSITCSKCGYADKLNRNEKKFHCIKCGFQEDADYNASLNIRQKGIESLDTNDKKKLELQPT